MLYMPTCASDVNIADQKDDPTLLQTYNHITQTYLSAFVKGCSMKPLEDMDDNISSSGFEPLFINEEDGEPDRTERNTAQSGLHFTGISLNPSALIKPYLQEMDDLLKSCEELTGIPFGSRFSESYTETSVSGANHLQGKDEVAVESYTGTSVSPQAYLTTSYIDTQMDEAGIEDQPAQCQSQSMGTVINRCEVTPKVSRQTEMPLTSVGNKLSDTMVEYEGRLMGMLAMLESCMEEAGMDFKDRDWATDTSQEYVHICKNPGVCRGMLVPIQQERSEEMEAQPMQLEPWAAQHADEDNISKDRREEMTQCSDNIGLFSVERVGRSENFITDQGVLDSHFRFSGSSKSFDGNENDSVCCEGTKGEFVFKEGTETKGGLTGTEIPAQHELKMDTTCFRSGMDELQELGTQLEECIGEVQLLQTRRKELLTKVLELRGNKDREDTEGRNEAEEETEEGISSKVAELMNVLKKEEEARREERRREIQSLKEERAEEERRMWKVDLERQGLQDELRKLKRRLFTVARDCAYNQATLNAQHRTVELLKREEV